MKILAITASLPYPLTDGARICMFQSAQGLAALGHEIHIVAVDDQKRDPGPLKEFCRVHIVRQRAWPQVAGALVTLFSRHPYTQWKKDLPAMYEYLGRLQIAEDFDASYADQTHVACYGAYMKRRYGLPYLLRSHNMEYEIYQRYAQTLTNPFMRRYVALQCMRWKRYEAEQLRAADACAVITDRDKVETERLAPGVAVDVIPGAVDLNRFPYVPTDRREAKSLVVAGNMAWAPNRVSTLWFMNEVLPLVLAEEPEVICRIVGNSPGIRGLPVSRNIRLEGCVDNIHPLYDRAAIGVLPVRVAGGMRIKMLEMMSSGLPIVATSVGAEGNAAVAGLHYLRADDAPAFANAITSLLRSPLERRRLSLVARSFVAQRYDTRHISRKFENLLVRMVDSSLRVR